MSTCALGTLSCAGAMCNVWGQSMNGWNLRGLGCALALAVGSALAADAPTNTLPPLDTVLHGIVQKAEADARIEQEFLARYAFIHTLTRHEYNPKGKLKKRKTETVSHDPTSRDSTPPPSLSRRSSQGRDDHSHARPGAAANEQPMDRPYEREDVVVTDGLMRRFEFTLLGRETWESLPLLKLDFRPVVPNLPSKGVLDRLINSMAGTLWVDERDYSLARISLRLIDKVNVGVGGLLGSVSAFQCEFERLRTPEGLWYTRRVDWRAEYREFLVGKIVEQQETRTEVRRVTEK